MLVLAVNGGQTDIVEIVLLWCVVTIVMGVEMKRYV
jgi:hypothetical protein